MKMRIVSVALIASTAIAIAGCGVPTHSLSDKTASNTASATRENSTNATVNTTLANDARSNNTANITHESSNAPSNSAHITKNTHSPKVISVHAEVKALVPILSIWHSDAEQIRKTINGNMKAFDNLPSMNYGTEAFFVYFDSVKTEYNTISQLYPLLNKQTSKIESYINAHPKLQKNNHVGDIAQRIEKVDSDINSAESQIGKELKGSITLANEFKNGQPIGKGVPYWTFNEWNGISQDQANQWNHFIIDYETLRQS